MISNDSLNLPLILRRDVRLNIPEYYLIILGTTYEVDVEVATFNWIMLSD